MIAIMFEFFTLHLYLSAKAMIKLLGSDDFRTDLKRSQFGLTSIIEDAFR